MTEKPVPRDPHPDNDLIEEADVELAAQSGRSGGRVAEEIASRDEEKSALGADPERTGVTKSAKLQPNIPTRADHQGAQGSGHGRK